VASIVGSGTGSVIGSTRKVRTYVPISIGTSIGGIGMPTKTAARALVCEDGVQRAVVERIVPGFCRHALEAACVAAVRRRRLLRGDSHAAVEKALEQSPRLMIHLALALFDDAAKGPGAHLDQQSLGPAMWRCREGL
jgi:hypothetical protein